MKKRVLIISPVGDLGGRELEVGFIAETLSFNYKVTVLSTADFSKNSQVSDFKGFVFISLNKLLIKNNFVIKILSKIDAFFKKDFVYEQALLSRPFFKKLFSTEFKKKSILLQNIDNSDIIFFVAQLSSTYVNLAVDHAKKENKTIIFRTTGNIEINTINDYNYLKAIDLFIHHSKNNAEKLDKTYPFKIIDQCSFNEQNLLNISILKEKVTTFMTVSRLDRDKNIDVLIKSFLKVASPNSKLYIVGDGPESENLKKITQDPRITFTGFIPNQKLAVIFKKSQCFIVSYYKKEAGPLTGIEAMAAGKIIISAKTGAMLERLKNLESFWFDGTTKNLIEQMNRVVELDVLAVNRISLQNRNNYIKNYAKEVISKKYLKAILDNE